MEFFTSQELWEIVADYDSRNGAGIVTELELMSALAKAGIRCSVGIQGLQEYLLEHHRTTASAASAMGDALGNSTILAAGESSAVGCQSPQPQSSTTGENRVTSPRNDIDASGSRTKHSQQSSKKKSASFRTSAVSPNLRPLASADPRPVRAEGVTASSVPAVSDRHLVSRLRSITASPTGNHEKSQQDGSAVDAHVPFDHHTKLSARSQSRVAPFRSGTGADRLLSARGTRSFAASATPLSAPPQLPNWLRLELPLTTADFVQLVITLKASLYRGVLSDAKQQDQKGNSSGHHQEYPTPSSGGGSLMVNFAAAKEAAIAVITERIVSGRDGDCEATAFLMPATREDLVATMASSPVATSVMPLLLGESSVAADAPGASRKSLRRGTCQPKSAASTRNIPSDVREVVAEAAATVDEHYQKFSLLPASERKHRTEQIEQQLALFREELQHVIEDDSVVASLDAIDGQPAIGGVQSQRWGEDSVTSTHSPFGSFRFASAATLRGDWDGSGVMRSVQLSDCGSPQSPSPKRKEENKVKQSLRTLFKAFSLDSDHIFSDYESEEKWIHDRQACLRDQQQQQARLQKKRLDDSPDDSGPTSPVASLQPKKFLNSGLSVPAVATTDVSTSSSSFVAFLLAQQEAMVKELSTRIESGAADGTSAVGEPTPLQALLYRASGGKLDPLLASPAAAQGGGVGASGRLGASKRWNNASGKLGGAMLLSTNFVSGGFLESSLNSPASGGTPLDEATLSTASADVELLKQFEGRTPRKSDALVSGIVNPIDQIVERCLHRVREMRNIVPMELQFPYAATVAAKDVKRVNSVDEMIDDLCHAAPNSKIHTVANALRDHRHARLNPTSTFSEARRPQTSVQEDLKGDSRVRPHSAAAGMRGRPSHLGALSSLERRNQQTTRTETPPPTAQSIFLTPAFDGASPILIEASVDLENIPSTSNAASAKDDAPDDGVCHHVEEAEPRDFCVDVQESLQLSNNACSTPQQVDDPTYSEHQCVQTSTTPLRKAERDGVLCSKSPELQEQPQDENLSPQMAFWAQGGGGSAAAQHRTALSPGPYCLRRQKLTPAEKAIIALDAHNEALKRKAKSFRIRL